MKKIVYLDYAATTPVDPRVLKAMLPYFSKKYGNTMSLHQYGQEASLVVEKTRSIIAGYIHAEEDEIYFTGSATESNNFALKGVISANKYKKKNHLIISRIEHDCVLESAHWLKSQGFDVTEIGVDHEGFLDIKELEKAITPRTCLVSIIHGNNEIGTIQDIETISAVCQKHNVYFHTDASQSFGKVPIDVKKMNIDLLTASSHKIYGPKGAALLYIRKGVVIEPILHGGGHERGKRSSTVNVPAIVGFGKACEILKEEENKEHKKLSKLRDFLIDEILKIPGTKLNGPREKRLSNNVNISFSSIEGESLTMELDFGGVAVSTGSACSSKNLMPSHVLTAIGLSHPQAHGSLRFSVGRFTTKQELRYALSVLKKAVTKLRAISPISL